jgi:hypothetical protein
VGAHVPVTAQSTDEVKSVLVETAVLIEHVVVNVDGNYLTDY